MMILKLHVGSLAIVFMYVPQVLRIRSLSMAQLWYNNDRSSDPQVRMAALPGTLY